MAIDEPQTQDHEVATDQRHHLTAGVLSLIAGLVGVDGGGILANVFFYLTLDNTASSFDTQAAEWLPALPPAVMGILAIVLGLVAARSSRPVDTAIGRAGVIIGVVAILGALLMAVATLSSPDVY